jgi:hypothetical protein
MSRSLGDIIAHRVGVIPVADLKTCEITEADKLLILASDGWLRCFSVSLLAIVC